MNKVLAACAAGMGKRDPLAAVLVGGPSDPIKIRAPKTTLFKEAHLESPAIPWEIWKPLNGRLFSARADMGNNSRSEALHVAICRRWIVSAERHRMGLSEVPDRWKALKNVNGCHFGLCP